MIILGIETSCDETAVALLKADGEIDNLHFAILGSSLISQANLHAQYGGVFPNLAKREHIRNLPLVYKHALTNAKISESEIDLVTVTVGPGLEPALWTGISFAEELSKRLGKPLLGANHMLGHIVSVLMNKNEEFPISNLEFLKIKIKFPAIALLISGGHTELVSLLYWWAINKIGETQDDAVGEAFDKVARMLGLTYPGGPEIARLAEEAREKSIKNKTLKLPRPMMNSGDFNFSFSGLKTAVLYYIKKSEILGEKEKKEIAREFEEAVIETLVSKTKKAIEAYRPQTLIVGGGVIANKALRQNFLGLKKNYPEIEVLIPEKSLTTDNATMIAAAGYLEYLKNQKINKSLPLEADGNLSLG